jgi:hypothetical protein
MANTKTEKKTTSKTAATKKTSTKTTTPKIEEVIQEVDQAVAVVVEEKPVKVGKQTKAPKSATATEPVAEPVKAKAGKKGKATKATKEAVVAEPTEEVPVAVVAAVTKTQSKKASTKSQATAVNAPENLKVANKKTARPAKVPKGENDEEDDEPGKRYFKCIMINGDGEAIATGRYSGKKPKQAASKACTRLYEEQKESGLLPEKIVFGMHESTRASKKKKKYFYVGRRVELEEPEEVEIDKIDPKTGNKMVIKYYYNNDVRKLTNLEECQEYPMLCNYDTKDEGEQVDAPVKKLKGGKKGGKKAVAKKASAKTAKTTKAKTTKAKTASKKQSVSKKVDATPDITAEVKNEPTIKVKKSDKTATTKAKTTKAAKVTAKATKASKSVKQAKN